jgi:hypothetical protein
MSLKPPYRGDRTGQDRPSYPRVACPFAAAGHLRRVPHAQLQLQWPSATYGRAGRSWPIEYRRRACGLEDAAALGALLPTLVLVRGRAARHGAAAAGVRAPAPTRHICPPAPTGVTRFLVAGVCNILIEDRPPPATGIRTFGVWASRLGSSLVRQNGFGPVQSR